MMSLRAAVRHERSAPERADGEERRGAHLRVVDDPAAEPRPRRSAGGLLGTLAVVLLLASVFGIVVFQVFLVQAQSSDQVVRSGRQEGRAGPAPADQVIKPRCAS
jgi:predicted lipid-binding transport protein (Tim44 family)